MRSIPARSSSSGGFSPASNGIGEGATVCHPLGSPRAICLPPYHGLCLLGCGGFGLTDAFHQEAVGFEACLVVVNLRGDDQFIGFCPLNEILELAAGCFGAADRRGGKDLAEDGAGFQR